MPSRSSGVIGRPRGSGSERPSVTSLELDNASRRAGHELRTRSSILFQVTSAASLSNGPTVARRQPEGESDRVCRRGLGARRLGAECNRPWIAVSLSEVLFMVLTTKRKITPSQLSRILGRQRPKSAVVRSDCFGSNGRTSPFQGSMARSGEGPVSGAELPVLQAPPSGKCCPTPAVRDTC